MTDSATVRPEGAAEPATPPMTLGEAHASLARVLESELASGDADRAGYVRDHDVRFHETLARMWPVLGRSEGAHVLCLGGLSIFESWAAATFHWDFDTYDRDLRLPLDVDPNRFDLVMMLEVIEHLADVPTTDFPTEFAFTGMKACLSEVTRVLRPGGHLLLSTPNSVSLDCIGQALLGRSPFQYTPHIRELTPDELRDMVISAGLRVVDFGTAFVWNPQEGFDRMRLKSAVEALGFDSTHRGDDMFLLAAK